MDLIMERALDAQDENIARFNRDIAIIRQELEMQMSIKPYEECGFIRCGKCDSFLLRTYESKTYERCPVCKRIIDWSDMNE